MGVTFDWLLLVGASISVVGVIEWLKGFFPKAPSWIWRIVLAPVSLGVAIAADGGPFQIATNTLALLAMGQIGYPMLIQLPGVIVEFFKRTLNPGK
jgi:hypothetical protein